MGTTGFEHYDVRSFQPVCKYNPLTMGLSHQRECIPKIRAQSRNRTYVQRLAT